MHLNGEKKKFGNQIEEKKKIVILVSVVSKRF